jgi:EF hand domain-containing protein
MIIKRRTVLAITGFLGLFALGATPRAFSAQKVDKSVPKAQRTLALGEDEVKQLLLLMDTDKNGKISKKEFMQFMETEFERLDKDKSGELDPKELLQSRIRAARPAVGK